MMLGEDMREIAVALLLAWSSAALAEPPGAGVNVDCTAAIATAERASDIPSGLLAAIAHVESGRLDPGAGAVQSWPWTIDVGGDGRFFATKAEAIAATAALQEQGIASIDVGCLQVNLAYHPAAFASLAEAFDPLANALYAARFLRVLFSQSGDWPAAVAAYHSQTSEVGAAYQGKVLAVWTPPASAAPPPADSRLARFSPANWTGAGLRDRDRWSAVDGKPPLPERTVPAAPPVWIERVIGAVARCSAATEAAPSGAAPVWKTATGMCPSSPFARPAALRQLLTQR
jgi:Transglycosylase SLT domain